MTVVLLLHATASVCSARRLAAVVFRFEVSSCHVDCNHFVYQQPELSAGLRLAATKSRDVMDMEMFVFNPRAKSRLRLHFALGLKTRRLWSPSARAVLQHNQSNCSRCLPPALIIACHSSQSVVQNCITLITVGIHTAGIACVCRIGLRPQLYNRTWISES